MGAGVRSTPAPGRAGSRPREIPAMVRTMTDHEVLGVQSFENLQEAECNHGRLCRDDNLIRRTNASPRHFRTLLEGPPLAMAATMERKRSNSAAPNSPRNASFIAA